MKHFIKIDRSTIRPNPDYSLFPKMEKGVKSAIFTVTDTSVLVGDSPQDLRIKYPEFEGNYMLTNIVYESKNGSNPTVQAEGVFTNGLIPTIFEQGKTWDGIDIKIHQEYIETFPDTRQYLYEYHERPEIWVTCDGCKARFEYGYMDEYNTCPVCGEEECTDVNVEYEQFNLDMV